MGWHAAVMTFRAAQGLASKSCQLLNNRSDGGAVNALLDKRFSLANLI